VYVLSSPFSSGPSYVHVEYHVFNKSGRTLDGGTTEMDQYATELFER
jgi:hypothetical protein